MQLSAGAWGVGLWLSTQSHILPRQALLASIPLGRDRGEFVERSKKAKHDPHGSAVGSESVQESRVEQHCTGRSWFLCVAQCQVPLTVAQRSTVPGCRALRLLFCVPPWKNTGRSLQPEAKPKPTLVCSSSSTSLFCCCCFWEDWPGKPGGVLNAGAAALARAQSAQFFVFVFLMGPRPCH